MSRIKPVLGFLLTMAFCPGLTPLLAQESFEIEVAGGSLNGDERGSGPALVMIHDGLLPSVTWENQVGPLAKKYRVIRYDRRGYGESPPAKELYSPIDDLVAVLDQLDISDATLIGCSSGGRLAVDFTLAHPQRVNALVLVGPVVSGMSYSNHFRERERAIRQPLDKRDDLEGTLDLWAADPYATDQRNKAARERFRELLLANKATYTTPKRAARPDTPALERLGQIQVSTLLVVGESDIPDVHSHVGALEAGIDGSIRVVISQAGHLAHFEQPEVFNRLVLDFLP